MLGRSLTGASTRVNLAREESDQGRAWPAVSRPSDKAASSSSGSAYTALTPDRILDSRRAGGGGPLGPNSSRVLPVVTAADGVPDDATAVAINVTVTNTTAASFLTLYPTGGSRPGVSDLNWVRGETVGNLVMVPVGTGGDVTVYNLSGDTALVVDLEGYYSPEPSGLSAGAYVPLTPARITDTRPGSGYPNAGDTLRAGSILNVQVSGAGGVPSSSATAALLNVTVTGTTGSSFLTVWPTGRTRPQTSNLNWVRGETVANRVVVPLGSGGKISLYNLAGTTNVVVDVNGYFSDGSSTPAGAGLYFPLSPVRVLDTRKGHGPLGAGGTLSLELDDVDGIAADASAVVSNVTVANTTASSHLTVYPGPTRPNSSDLNWTAGEVVANLTVATLSRGGSTTFYNLRGETAVIFDASGYFAPLVLAVESESLPAGSVGSAYTSTLLAGGGTSPYKWQLGAGSLPSGLGLSTAGVISGTPTAAGSSSFTVEVTDSSTPTPQTATAALSIAISLAPATIEQSSNWSGYAITQGPYSEAEGTFVVPSLYAGDGASDQMSEWVGIDGLSDGNLIQAGVDEYPDPSDTDYFYIQPWWEILPAAETPIPDFTVAPGDSVTVTIEEVSPGEWTIDLDDTTESETFTTEQAYSAPLSSAEWIVEAPQVDGSIVALADYTETEFDQLELDGAQNTIYDLEMVQDDQFVSLPSAMVDNSFNVAYGNQAPAAP